MHKNQVQIVAQLSRATEVIYSGDYTSTDRFRVVKAAVQTLAQAGDTELVAVGRIRFNDAVGVQQDRGGVGQLEVFGGIIDIRLDARHQVRFQRQRVERIPIAEQRRRMTGGGN